MSKTEATAAPKRPFLEPVQRYVRETRAELAKVSWPTREEWLRLSGIVLVVMMAMAFVLGVADALGAQFIELLLGR